ncbi:MAG: EFR1 family ferrodoxin [Bacteroidales bacterium]|nr:EFR1 family ferrodoxin [Bacteroidales bacterium]
MSIENLKLVYFSPTKTTQSVVKTIGSGTNIKHVEEINLTTGFKESVEFDKNTLTIIGVPVYGGRVPLVAFERLKSLKANNSPVVIITVYGNRDYDDALLELKDLVSDNGFIVIAAAAFIGEHSYSTLNKPTAQGRPNFSDLKLAENFGGEIFEKLVRVSSIDEINELKVSGNYPYKELKNKPSLSPETILDKCILCGECIDVCPTGAINMDDQIHTIKQDCVWCLACVKFCKQNARIMDNEIIENFRDWLVDNCSDPKEVELYI